MPHMDDHRCRHCNALIALIPRASVVHRFVLRCETCGLMLVIWPLQKEPVRAYTERQQEAIV